MLGDDGLTADKIKRDNRKKKRLKALNEVHLLLLTAKAKMVDEFLVDNDRQFLILVKLIAKAIQLTLRLIALLKV